MFKNRNKKAQYILSVLLVSLVTTAGYLLEDVIGGYLIVAFLLFISVSLVAMFFDIVPVLIAATLSALALDFFFIEPRFTFSVGTAEDRLLFLMFFLIALVNAALTYKIRQAEKDARKKEEKEKAVQFYNTLLNSLSHELRTPISAIIGAVDTIQENKNNLSSENETALLQQIDEAGMRLNRQVENLLNMSRLESGMLRVKTDWCDINELVYSVVAKDVKAPHHSIVVNANEKLPLFKIDAGLMQQVIYNLLHNAITYTPNGSRIEVLVAHVQSCLQLTVTDNGPGFPQSEIQHVFDKFYRLPHTKTGGSGLGLSIAKGFVEAHNGTIKLKNKSNGGAEFTITIPAETSYINHLKNE